MKQSKNKQKKIERAQEQLKKKFAEAIVPGQFSEFTNMWPWIVKRRKIKKNTKYQRS